MPDANSHIILWLEVVIAGMIQTLILWFFQVNEIGNPHKIQENQFGLYPRTQFDKKRNGNVEPQNTENYLLQSEP